MEGDCKPIVGLKSSALTRLSEALTQRWKGILVLVVILGCLLAVALAVLWFSRQKQQAVKVHLMHKAAIEARHAPEGRICFAFTDMENSTRLWAAYPAAMPEVIALHDAHIRRLVEQYDGYEVCAHARGEP